MSYNCKRLGFGWTSQCWLLHVVPARAERPEAVEEVARETHVHWAGDGQIHEPKVEIHNF